MKNIGEGIFSIFIELDERGIIELIQSKYMRLEGTKNIWNASKYKIG